MNNVKHCVICSRRLGPIFPPSKKDEKVCSVCDQQGLVAPKKKPLKKKKINPLT